MSVQYSSARLTFVLVACLVLSTTAAITCQNAVNAALKTMEAGDVRVGVDFPCCSRTVANCTTVDGDCPRDFPEFSTCISVGGTVVCNLNADSQDTGSPCSTYKGTVGPYGFSPVDASNDLHFDAFGIIRTNWPRISTDDSSAVCCIANNGPCHMATTDEDDINACDPGEYELFCIGDSVHGMCTVRANTTHTKDIGQYYRVNLDTSSTSSSSASSSSTISRGPASAVSGSTAPDASATVPAPAQNSVAENPTQWKTHIALAIALPIVLALILASLFAVFFIRRRRARTTPPTTIDPLHMAARPAPLPPSTGYFTSEEENELTDTYYGGVTPTSTKGSQMYHHSAVRHVSLGTDYETNSSRHGPAPPTYSEIGH